MFQHVSKEISKTVRKTPDVHACVSIRKSERQFFGKFCAAVEWMIPRFDNL